jgi:hypothetical protein
MKSLKIYLIAGTVFLLVYIVAQINRPKAINWTETLNSKEKTPFGTYILFNRLHDIFPGSQIMPYHRAVYNAIAEDSIANSSYVIIAPYIEFGKPDYDELIKYLKIETTQYDNIVGSSNNQVNFLSPSLLPKNYYSVDKGVGNIYFSQIDTLKSIVLGENGQHKANFIKYTFGKGSLYLLCNPTFFSNYSLLKPQGAAYAATALSFIKNTNKLIWDQYYTQGDDENDSPMRLFLSNEALRWAYYTTLFSLLVFVIYEIKRRQRIIPVIMPLSNSTIEFVNVVGQVYYEKRNNTDIAHKKILYLLAHLRDEYQVKTSKLDDEFIEKLKTKLGIDAALATDLVNHIQQLDTKNYVSDRELIELNKLIEQFYNQAR